MYEPKIWQDHVTEYEDRYIERKNEDGSISHVSVEGEIIQQGTPQNAENFNHIEDGISNAGELAALLAVTAIHQQQVVKDLAGERITVDLTNTQEYPFNDSIETVSLSQERSQTDYIVTTEIVEYSGGFPGEIVISAKLQNGFKVAFTGSAKSVTVKLYVQGGFY